MSSHPYASLPDHCFWRRAVGTVPAPQVDPVVTGKFRITQTDRVASAGSCFAQNISRYLVDSGFNFLVTEQLNPFIDPRSAQDFNYGIYTARYGNIYTARQLLQLLQRAYGLFTPADDAWLAPNGRAFDPYRPQIQPNGFSSLRELHADRIQHFAAVRQAVEQADVLVFTLGLTEAWENQDDGAIYPICPGTAAGIFEPNRHRFVNFRMSRVLGDMIEAFDFIRERNRHIRFIVTVSPVPLVATAENRHVLVSTSYSKAVLRTVCGELEEQFNDVAYFPAYEIITGHFNRGEYFQSDLRNVTEAGVRHVMRLFMHHYAAGGDAGQFASEVSQSNAGQLAQAIDTAAAVICDEEVLDR